MPSPRLTEAQQRVLLDVARRSIDHGLQAGAPLPVDPGAFEAVLAAPGASFVTLHQGEELRGCIGALRAYRPLVRDVAEHAYAAAFSDPRFAPVTPRELPALRISVSVLTEPEPLLFESEQDLLAQLRPGADGLIIEDAGHRGTFLPSVWESLPERRQFWLHLKLKANLPPDHWSARLKVWRYGSFSFEEPRRRDDPLAANPLP